MGLKIVLSNLLEIWATNQEVRDAHFLKTLHIQEPRDTPFSHVGRLREPQLFRTTASSAASFAGQGAAA